MLSDNIPMTLIIEKYRQRLLELRLDVERVQVYVLQSASATELQTTKQTEASQPPRKHLELAVPQ
jgi:hypothetical protein